MRVVEAVSIGVPRCDMKMEKDTELEAEAVVMDVASNPIREEGMTVLLVLLSKHHRNETLEATVDILVMVSCNHYRRASDQAGEIQQHNRHSEYL